MKRRSLLRAAAGAIAASCIVLPATLASADTLHLRISAENPMTGLDLQMAERFAQLLEEKLGDEFTYELHHTGALGDENVHLQMIRTGQIDVYPMGSDAVELDEAWAVFDMPFLFADRDAVARVLDGEVGEMLRSSMRERAGLEVLAFGELGFRQITNSVRPIVTPEDLNGLQIRVPGSATRVLTFQSYGAAPVTMNFGELYLALQQGTVDGQENPLIAIKNRSLYEVQNYLSLSNHVYTPVTLAMNGRKYDSLTDEQKAAVKEAALEAAKYTRGLGAEADQSLLSELSESLEVNEIDLAAFQAASEPVYEGIAEVSGAEIAARFREAATQ